MTNPNPADTLLKTDVLAQLETSALAEEVKTDVREWLQSQPGDTVLRQDAIKHMMGVVEIEEFVADTYSDVIAELEKTKADLEAVDEQAMIDELQAQRDGMEKMQAETDMAEKISQARVASASVVSAVPAESVASTPSVVETPMAPVTTPAPVAEVVSQAAPTVSASDTYPLPAMPTEPNVPAVSAMPAEPSVAVNDAVTATPAIETPVADVSAPSSSETTPSVQAGTPEPISAAPAPFFTAPQPAVAAAPLASSPVEATVVVSPQTESVTPSVDPSALQPATHVTTA